MKSNIYWMIQSILLGLLAACILTAAVSTVVGHQIYQYSIGIPFMVVAISTSVLTYWKIGSIEE